MAHQGIYLPPGDSAQQYYPNPYPHSSPLIQPPPPQQANHGPNQHYPSLARPSSFMPPPSTVPEDVNKWRNLQPQRPSNLWPRDVTEQQRHLQDRYSQNAQTSPINPYYAQQPTSTTAAAKAPTTAFTPPPGSQPGQYPNYQTQSPAATTYSARSMTATALPPVAPIKSEAVTPAPPSEPADQQPRGPSAPQQASTQQPAITQPITTTNPPQQTPTQSPTTAAPSPLESARVTALLDINRLLLQSIFSLQSPTKPATSETPDATDPGQAVQPQQGRPRHLANPHYSDYMRRLQSNLAYLACIADRPHKPQNPIPSFPAIMETPVQRKAEASSEGDAEREKELRQKYESLRELWPDWKGDIKKG